MKNYILNAVMAYLFLNISVNGDRIIKAERFYLAILMVMLTQARPHFSLH